MTTEHRHAWAPDQMHVGVTCMDCKMSQADWFFMEVHRMQTEIDLLNQGMRGSTETIRELRGAAERLQAYADSHPCDHMPRCGT